MKKDDVVKRVRAIFAERDDPEIAHALEDQPYRELLWAIAEGECDDPQGCAKEALKTGDMDFARWRA